MNPTQDGATPTNAAPVNVEESAIFTPAADAASPEAMAAAVSAKREAKRQASFDPDKMTGDITIGQKGRLEKDFEQAAALGIELPPMPTLKADAARLINTLEDQISTQKAQGKPSEKQVQFFEEHDMPVPETFADAYQIMSEYYKANPRLVSEGQRELLTKKGIEVPEGMTSDQADAAIKAANATRDDAWKAEREARLKAPASASQMTFINDVIRKEVGDVIAIPVKLTNGEAKVIIDNYVAGKNALPAGQKQIDEYEALSGKKVEIEKPTSGQIKELLAAIPASEKQVKILKSLDYDFDAKPLGFIAAKKEIEKLQA
jgi:hypothetical protein